MIGRSLLLRLLLCVALVSNGATSAMASVQRLHVDSARHAAVERLGEATMAGASGNRCHDDARAVPETTAVPMPAPAHPKPSRECCTSPACTCACVHQATAMLPATSALGVLDPPADSLRSIVLGHAAPTLPHPIRPPIG